MATMETPAVGNSPDDTSFFLSAMNFHSPVLVPSSVMYTVLRSSMTLLHSNRAQVMVHRAVLQNCSN